MASTEKKHPEDALATARAVYAECISRADTTLEAWQNEAAQRVRKSAENIASLESSLELLEALEQDRRAAALRLELHSAVQAHHDIVDGARNLVKNAMFDCAKAYAAAGVSMVQSLTNSFATA